MKFVGCDVSKDKIDINLINSKGVEVNRTILNQLKPIEKFISSLPKDYSLCAENTGAYSQLLANSAYYLGYDPKLIPSYSIKYGSGLIRGKTDKIDAKRIREFAERFRADLYPYRPESNTIIELREILSTRDLLSRLKVSAQNHIKSKNKLTSRYIYLYRVEAGILEHLKLIIHGMIFISFTSRLCNPFDVRVSAILLVNVLEVY